MTCRTPVVTTYVRTSLVIICQLVFMLIICFHTSLDTSNSHPVWLSEKVMCPCPCLLLLTFSSPASFYFPLFLAFSFSIFLSNWLQIPAFHPSMASIQWGGGIEFLLDKALRFVVVETMRRGRRWAFDTIIRSRDTLKHSSCENIFNTWWNQTFWCKGGTNRGGNNISSLTVLVSPLQPAPLEHATTT